MPKDELKSEFRNQWAKAKETPLVSITAIVVCVIILTGIGLYVIAFLYQKNLLKKDDLIATYEKKVELCENENNDLIANYETKIESCDSDITNLPNILANIDLIYRFQTTQDLSTVPYETWVLKEGQYDPPEWIGNWVVPTNESKFKCEQKNRINNDVIDSECTVIQIGPFIIIQRFNTSNDNDCRYFGVRAGNSVVGKYNCISGGSYDWSATISRRN